MRRSIAVLLIVLMVCVGPSAWALDAVRSGELIVERPTLISLGFEWRVEGDANGNATARVQYRRAGGTEWSDYLPLYRIGLGSEVHLAMACGWPTYTIPDAVAGSIMDLQPGTEYEVRLELRDPDGVEGEAVRELTLKTRPEPRVPEDAPVRHVYPPDWDGPKEEPNFRNIMHAVNGYAPVSDVYLTVRPPMAAEPGTVIKMHGGLHRYDNQLYWKNSRPAHSYWQHGTMTLVAGGTQEKPIYIVPAGDGQVIIDGDGCHNLFNLRSTDYLHFEGLTIRNTDIAFHCGFQGLEGGGTKGLTLKNCWIENVVYGLLAQDGRSRDFYIADNVILGRGPGDEMGTWPRSETGYAVNIAGQGHVACHNYVANFWDGINVFTGSHSDPQWGQQSRSIDFYNNDIHDCTDQFIEADGVYANIRMLRNRMFNCPSQPISVQPVHAGPVYWVRNVLWRAGRGRMNMKRQMFAQAYVFLHNTSATHMSMPPNKQLRPDQATWIIQNNLAVGPEDASMPRAQFAPGEAGPNHVINHNAYRRGGGDDAWVAGETRAASLEEFRELTGYGEGSLLVDFSVFRRADEGAVFAPGRQFVLPGDSDLSPKEGGAVVDAGVALPGINDDCVGAGPDMGAYELGRPMPVYGPRGGPYLQKLRDLLESQRPRGEAGPTPTGEPTATMKSSG
ncbi:MAG: hypothetical protein R6X33_11260 [Candidatus Brocadiia bacterium]